MLKLYECARASWKVNRLFRLPFFFSPFAMPWNLLFCGKMSKWSPATIAGTFNIRRQSGSSLNIFLFYKMFTCSFRSIALSIYHSLPLSKSNSLTRSFARSLLFQLLSLQSHVKKSFAHVFDLCVIIDETKKKNETKKNSTIRFPYFIFLFLFCFCQIIKFAHDTRSHLSWETRCEQRATPK